MEAWFEQVPKRRAAILSAQCPACGAASPMPDARFCFRCGHSLDATDGYTPPHLEGVLADPGVAGGGERKDVAVLIADVAGSLAMSAALDPEDVHAVMNGFFAIANEAVHEESGSINQYRGDGFMALFGAPRALRDNAGRACRAALRIRSATERYAASVGARFGQPFVLRMGINVGLVWVGSIGTGLREDYTAEGPTVGVAARVEQMAPPGQILATAEVRERTAERFDWADLGSRSLRGIDEPVGVAELLRERPARPVPSLDGGEGRLPFVERPEAAGLAGAIGGSGPRRVHVVGEAGIGKTRLVLEGLRGVLPDHDVLLLQCRESSQREAFQALDEALVAWPADRAGRDRARRVRERIAGEASGRGDPGVADQLVELVDHQLTRRPLAIFVDDAHWLDATSADVLAKLSSSGGAEADEPGRELLLVTTRRQGTALPEGLLALGPEGHTLRMQSLGSEQSERIALAVLGSGSGAQDLARLAALRGGGNPLFVEELARSLREGSAGLRRAARLELALAQASAEVPRNLRGVVAARIDALSPAEKRALEAAAVLGQPFEPELLQELGISSQDVVSELRGRGLLRPGAGGRLDFRHGVVREVAYEQLVRPRRRELHLRAARALQRRDEGGSAAMAASIGGHLDAAEETEEAVRYRINAGRHFARLQAPAEAAVQLRRGLELLGDLPGERRSERAEAGVALASCLNSLDRSAEARAVLESVDAASVPESQRRLLARSLIQTGWVRFSEDGAVDGAVALMERGYAIAEAADPSGRILTLAHSFLSRIATLDGDGPSALGRTQVAMDHAFAIGDDLALSAALYNRVGACTNVGDVASAREAADRAAELAERRDDELLMASAVASEVRVAYFEGDTGRALIQAESGRRLAERCGQVGLLYGCLVVEGYAHLLAGQAPEARERFDELAALEQPWPTTELHRARGRVECGDLDGAVELASLCLERRPTRLVRARALAVRGLARGLRSAIDIDAAERDLAEAVSVCDDLGVAPFRAEAQGFLADLWAARGDDKRAAYYRERAAAGYRRCGMERFAAEFGGVEAGVVGAVASGRT